MFKFVTVSIALLSLLAVSTAQTRLTGELLKARRACKSQQTLICNVVPVSESSVMGKVWFTPSFRIKDGTPECAVRIRAMITGLTGPRHGFHIHTYGDLSAEDGTSTGGHYANPEGSAIDHGMPEDAVRHWGDLGNLRNRGGTAKLNRIDRVISLAGIVGHGITLHAGRDMGSEVQPTGGSGSRVAACVIGFANPETVISVM